MKITKYKRLVGTAEEISPIANQLVKEGYSIEKTVVINKVENKSIYSLTLSIGVDPVSHISAQLEQAVLDNVFTEKQSKIIMDIVNIINDDLAIGEGYYE